MKRELKREFLLSHATESWKGSRKVQNEDRYIQYNDIFPGPLYGVFDGHGGKETVEFVTHRFPEILRTRVLEQGNIKAMEENLALESDPQRKEQLQKDLETILQTLLTDACSEMDCEWFSKHEVGCGSTALMAFFLGESSYATMNLGDCRAVLCRGKYAVRLTQDHKPNNESEKIRIEAAGGIVKMQYGLKRVTRDGVRVIQTVSRGFGDRELKLPSNVVSCRPDVKLWTVEPDDLFLILASDGIWDVITDQEAVELVRNQYLESLETAATSLLREATRRGSQDDLTATIIQLDQTVKRSKANEPEVEGKSEASP